MSTPAETVEMDQEVTSAEILARLALKALPPRAGVTDVLSPTEAYERILAAWKADVERAYIAGHDATIQQVIEMLDAKIRPGHRAPVLDRNGRLMTATKIREWLTAMVEALR